MLRFVKASSYKSIPKSYPSTLRFKRFESSSINKDTNNNNDTHQYANTVFLPNTSFGNRSDQKLIDSTLKPQVMEKLYNWNISRPLKDNNIDNLFIFHDGPPYANGNLHIGHALNKILKDIINRFELMLGKKVHYVPGWDCHGLPIELKTLEKLSKRRKEIEKKLKKDLKKYSDDSVKVDEIKEELHKLKHTRLSSTDIVKLSSEHAISTQKNQSKEFQEMGIMGDFENPYMTLNKSYVIDQLRIFKKFFDNGLVHRQEKPVYWGCENATALAEGELEYNQQHNSKAAYVKFPIAEINDNELKGIIGEDILKNGLSALIWTSTPWTLASNLAISINEDFDYTIISNPKFGNLIVSVDLIPNLEKIFEFNKTNIKFKGSKLLNCKYKSIILNNNKTYPFLHGSHVTNIAGTGLVHTAPGHGQDDYLVCLKNGIKPYSPVDKFGKYTNEIEDNLKDLIGLKVLTDGNNKMIEKIKDLDILIYLDENYIHSYPYDWRSKKPIIIRATPQWFIDVSKIKDITINALKNQVNFHPERGINRLTSFIRTRNEWCISRQRSWGVPIPVLYHKVTGDVLLNDSIIGKIIEVIEKEGIEGWFKQVEESQKNLELSDISKWLPKEFKNLSKDYILGTDTMDVWFDSGSSWKTIENYLEKEGLIEQANKRGYLSDIYLEGSDQHRGWFQSSVLNKIGSEINEIDNNNNNNKVMMPYKNIITHGFTLDEKGEKMSKSIGNTISPADILNGNKSTKIPKIGIDGLRLWVAQSDYTSDISVGPTILKHVGDNLKKIRFTFKFLLGNLNGFDKSESLKYEDLNKLDQYILSKLSNLNKECLKDYQEFNYFKVVKSINHFINVELSSIYFDIRKDSLYTDKINSNKRISTLIVFEEILKTIVSILSPIIPIISQEVWNNVSKNIKGNTITPFEKGWYNGDKYIKFNEEIEKDFRELLKMKDSVNGMISKLRSDKLIRSPLECSIVINGGSEILNKYSDEELEDIFVVSGVVRNKDIDVKTQVYHVEDSISEGITIHVVKSDGDKCPRCWKHNVQKEISQHENEQVLCVRCSDVVKSL